MCFLKELRPLANVSIFSVCHVHGHASLFLDRLGFQYKLNGDDRSVPNFCVYVICISIDVFIFSQLLPRKAATIGRKVYFHMSRGHTSLARVKVDT